MRFDGATYDCGSRLGFLTANLAFALDRGDIAPGLKEALSPSMKKIRDSQPESPSILGQRRLVAVRQAGGRQRVHGVDAAEELPLLRGQFDPFAVAGLDQPASAPRRRRIGRLAAARTIWGRTARAPANARERLFNMRTSCTVGRPR